MKQELKESVIDLHFGRFPIKIFHKIGEFLNFSELNTLYYRHKIERLDTADVLQEIMLNKINGYHSSYTFESSEKLESDFKKQKWNYIKVKNLENLLDCYLNGKSDVVKTNELLAEEIARRFSHLIIDGRNRDLTQLSLDYNLNYLLRLIISDLDKEKPTPLPLEERVMELEKSSLEHGGDALLRLSIEILKNLMPDEDIYLLAKNAISLKAHYAALLYFKLISQHNIEHAKELVLLIAQEKSYKAIESHSVNLEIAQKLSKIAENYLKLNKDEEARAYYLQAIEMYGGEEKTPAEVLNDLAGVCLKLGDDLKAYFYHTKAQKQMDSQVGSI